MGNWQELLQALGLPPTVTGEPLSNSPVARSWKATSEGRAVVLRQDKPLARQLGLDREREWRCLKQAWSIDLAPEPLKCLPAQGLLMTAYCEGAGWDEDPAHSWAAHGRLLAQLHESTKTSPPDAKDILDPLAAGKRYAQLSDEAATAHLVKQLASLWNDLKGSTSLSLCHNDAHRGNIIGGQSPRFIDWEYAAWGDPLCDLAIVWRYHDLNAAKLELFLSGYGLSVDEERLEHWAALYDALSELWARAMHPDPSPSGIR